jgi:hypothetical protein
LFAEGQVIYFSPFYFKNGNTSKNKYFIVLRNIENTVLIASLPTSSDKLPSFIDVTHGCVNDEERCLNCYLFEAGKPITVNGFFFKRPTFIYGNEVETYDVEIMSDVYCIEGIDYEVMGLLLQNEFESIINCLVNSSSVKRGIKRQLSQK